MRITTGIESIFGLGALLLFLWLYTWAAVPEYLREPLLDAVSAFIDITSIAGATHPWLDPWLGDPLHDLTHRGCGHEQVHKLVKNGLGTACALCWVMQSDPTFERWRLGRPLPDAFQRYESSVVPMDGHARDSRSGVLPRNDNEQRPAARA